MPENTIFNTELFREDRLPILRNTFEGAAPFRHLIIDEFLQSSFADNILKFFPPLLSMKTHYTGLNERKAEDTNFEKLDKIFTSLHEALSSPEFLNWLEAITSISPIQTIDDRLGYGLHQGGNRSFLDIHIDYNIHPIHKLRRRLNLLLFFNPHWESQWGGNLEFWDSKVENRIQNIVPQFNRAVIFECSEISFHGYSRMIMPEGITRKSYYQYYFTPVAENTNFHDTLFKPRPEDSVLKKIVVPAKEYLKNAAKKILLSLGFEKFLK
jgi:Rps23 Pro-64 3,4-dihydroxylase Tpa1-like proline 4-hydroxylase